MPIIQTQLATPVQANRSYHTEQSSARRASLENGQKDEQAPREPQGRRTSIDRVDEGLEAAANETEPHARRGSGDDKEKDTARDDEKRTLWLGDLVSLAPWTQKFAWSLTCRRFIFTGTLDGRQLHAPDLSAHVMESRVHQGGLASLT
jgi:hypothetical protein